MIMRTQVIWSKSYVFDSVFFVTWENLESVGIFRLLVTV